MHDAARPLGLQLFVLRGLGRGCLLITVLIALALPAACRGIPQIIDLDATVSSHIPTVVLVHGSVDTADSLALRVEYGVGDTFGQSVSRVTEEDGTFQIYLLGLPAGTVYQARVVVEYGEDEAVSDTLTFETGDIPPHLPMLSISGDDMERMPDGYFVSTLRTESRLAMIVEGGGQILWWYDVPDAETGTTRLSSDGLHMIATTNAGYQKMRLDGSDAVMVEVPESHHDFAVLPDGKLGFLAYDYREIVELGGLVQGTQIIEVAGDGTQEQVWSAWDSMELDPDWIGEDLVWGHANAIDYDEREDVYYVSFLTHSSIVKIDRATGEVVWSLGGLNSDFSYQGSDWLFTATHQFQRLENGIVAFENGDEESHSSVVQFDFDEASTEAELVWSHAHDPPMFSTRLGDVTRTQDDLTFITWSLQGQIELVALDHQVLWRANAPEGMGIGYATWVPAE